MYKHKKGCDCSTCKPRVDLSYKALGYEKDIDGELIAPVWITCKRCGKKIIDDGFPCDWCQELKRLPIYHPDNWPDGVYDPREAVAFYGAKIAELEVQLEDQQQLISELDDMREQRNKSKAELNLAWDAATEYKAERDKLMATGPRFAELLVERDMAEKELRVMRRAGELAGGMTSKDFDWFIEAARKELS